MNEFADLIADVRELKTDVYTGKGKDNPSITTRLVLLEDAVERNEKMTNEKFDKYDSLLNKALWFGASAALASIGSLLKAIFFPHVG